MKNSEALRAALDLLGPNGERWVQRGAAGPDYCAGLAVREAARDARGSWTLIHESLHLLIAEADLTGGGVAPLFVWNDDPHTTWEDVHLTFKRAIAAAEETGD